jgi:prepilin-type N-terminal cleavage/methylation domain-containing protein
MRTLNVGHPGHCRTAGYRTLRGFTLIELLLVLGIISALIAMGLVVGRQVVTGSKTRVTEQLITTLDQSVDSYVADKGQLPPPVYSHTVSSGGTPGVYEFPAFDGRPAGTARSYPGVPSDQANYYAKYDSTVPSLATYTAILKQSALSESIVKAMPSKFVRARFLDQWYRGTAAANEQPIDFLPGTDVQSFEVIDPFGNPIRFVHPGFGREEFFDGPSGTYYDPAGKAMVPAQGISRAFNHMVFVRWGAMNTAPRELQFRRSYQPFTDAQATSAAPAVLTGDADEGICPTRRPYFYSVGPDGDPGKRSDNIYTVRPEFPDETAAFNAIEN